MKNLLLITGLIYKEASFSLRLSGYMVILYFDIYKVILYMRVIYYHTTWIIFKFLSRFFEYYRWVIDLKKIRKHIHNI